MSTQEDRCAALLDAWLDGALTAEEAAEAEALLAESPTLLSYVEDVLAIRAAFPAAEETEVDAGFSARVLARIEAEDRTSRADGISASSAAADEAVRPAPVKTGRRTERRGWYRSALLPLAACLALAVLIGGMGILRQPKGAGGAAAPAAAAPAVSAGGAASGGSADGAKAQLSKEEPAMAPPLPEPAPAQAANDAVAAPESAPSAAAPPFEAEEDEWYADAYAAVCTIPMSRAEGLLDDIAPIFESERELRYEIPSELFAMWLEQGAFDDMNAQIDMAADPAEGGMVLVIIRK